MDRDGSHGTGVRGSGQGRGQDSLGCGGVGAVRLVWEFPALILARMSEARCCIWARCDVKSSGKCQSLLALTSPLAWRNVP